jgi:tetratricopeptide (TPR) repeat protein
MTAIDLEDLDRARVGTGAANVSTLAPRASGRAPVAARRRIERCVGRAVDLRALRDQLSTEPRVVALHGLPGVGKSTLARAVLPLVADLFPGGCFAVDAASVARAVTIEDLLPELRGDGVLPGGRTLLVIDDADDAIATLRRRLGRWLDEAPETWFLVTSRKRLGSTRERAIEVRPLGDADARTLLTERAAGPLEPAVVEEVLAHAEGLPLALEWLAGEPASREVPTLRTAIDGNIDRLGAAATALLQLAASFEESLSLDLLSRAAATLPATARRRVDLLLTELFDLSLLRPIEAGRVVLPGIVRACVVERPFDRRAARRAIERAYADWLAIALPGEPRDQGETELARHELPNLVALQNGDDHEAAVRAALVHAALVRTGDAEGDREAILAAAETRAEASADPRLLVAVLGARSQTARTPREIGLLLTRRDRALALLGEDATDPGLVEIVLSLGTVRQTMGDLDAAQACFGEAILRAGGDLSARARAYRHGSLFAAYQGLDVDEHLERLQRACDLFAEAGELRDEARTQLARGTILLERADYERASSALLDAVDLFRLVSDRRGEAIARFYRASLLDELGDLDRAREEHLRALEFLRVRGDAFDLMRGEMLLGVTLLQCGDLDGAIQQFERAVGHAERAADANTSGLVRALRALGLRLAGRDGAEGDAVALAPELLVETMSPREWTLFDVTRSLTAAFPLRDPAARDALEATLEARHPALRSEDADSDVRLARRLLRMRLLVSANEAGVPRLVIEQEFGAFRVGDQRVDLAPHRLLRRLLGRLSRATAATPASLDELVRAGWPGEKVSKRSAAQRVHTAIRRLRELGLAGLLRSDRSGYWLACEIERG